MLKIREVAETRGIHNPYQLHTKTNVNLSTCQKLWAGVTGLNVSTLVQIADALDCSLDDLVERSTAQCFN